MPSNSTPARSGNAIVLAIGVMAIAAAIISSTTNNMVVSVGSVRQSVDHAELVAAVSTTLVRRERMLSQAATLGAEGFVRRFDPEYDYDLDTVGFVGSENYGVDYIGGAQVRWRIQPVKAREDGVWKQNPRADGEGAALELPNTFLFRVEAEGRLPGTDGRPRSVVQGTRYSAISKEPLFRYIIFYSQEGPKGDIEFAHGPTFSAKGSVHTNGSIYLGGAAIRASWDALNSGLMDGKTLLGPYKDPYGGSTAPTSPALVNAYDGIFRLSKQVLYNRANGFPISGTAPSGFATDWYALSGTVPGESGSAIHYRSPPSSSATVLAATHGGTEVNPHRVTNDALATTETTDDRRQINGIAVRGVNAGLSKANDSRDRHRSGGLVWATDSLGPDPNGFNKMARSSDNGGRIVRLPTIMGNRAFEAQRLRYDDVDGDPSTDNHEYARPLFLTATGETANHPSSAGPVVESPGAYMAFALGSPDLAMTRVMRGTSTSALDISAGYNAWAVTDKSGAAASTAAGQVGLIVRERMQPDLNYLSGSATSSASPDYIPYAYGKHMRSTKWPLWPVDVSAQMGSDNLAGRRTDEYVRHVYTTTKSSGHISGTLNKQSYADGGMLTAAAAADTSFGEATDSISGYKRWPTYYRSNWRMFHLQRPSPDESQQGLVATATYDFDTSKTWLAGGGWLGPFGGQVVSRILWDTTINHTNFSTLLSGTPAAGQDYFSVRWTGFIKPPVSGAYTFYFGTDDGGRLWVNDVRLADQWALQGVTVNGGGEKSTVTLEQDRWYPIVAEMFEKGGGQGAQLEWSASGLPREFIPASRCAPPAGSNGGAFARSQWKSVQAKIAPTSVPIAGKIGLMVRPLAARAPATPPGETIVVQAESGTSVAGTVGGLADLWAPLATPPAGSNGSVMALKQTGSGSSGWPNPSADAPYLQYTIQIDWPGTYYFWGRYSTPGSDYNTAYVVLAGVSATPTAGFASVTRAIGPYNSSGGETFGVDPVWDNRADQAGGGPVGPVSFTITTAGSYSLRIASSDARFGIDQFLLTTDASLVPSGATISAGPIAGAEKPAPGLPCLQDGRDPYVTLAYSPTRGVFAEFRGEQATSDGRSPPRYFTGTSAATDANGEQGVAVAGTTRQAVLTPSLVTSDSDSSTIVEDRKNNDKQGTTTSPTKTNNLEVSEGKYDGVQSGPWSRYRSYQPQVNLIRRISTTWRFTLGGTSTPATQVFNTTGDANKTLSFYTDTTAADQTGLVPSAFPMNGSSPVISNWSGTQFDATWTTSENPDWQDWAALGSFTNGNVETISSVVVGDTTFSDVALTTTVTANTVTKTWSLGTANTYWYPTNDPPKYDGTSNIVPYDKFKTNIEAKFPGAFVVKIDKTPTDPVGYWSDSFYQADPPSDYLTAPAGPTAWANGTTARTFALDRTSTVVFDLNSYVGSWGTWWFGASQQKAVLPWVTSTLWNGITSPPTTGGFRPDLWSYKWGTVTAKTNYPRRAGITDPADNPTNQTDSALTQIGSPRWSSDQPSAWPPDAGLPANVWLRIERSTGDVLTLSYALTTGSPAPADWVTVKGLDGNAVSWPINNWTNDLLIGPCIQSGSKNSAAEAVFSDMQVEFHANQSAPEVAAVDTAKAVLNATDWESADASGVVDIDRYMAGQYQVFFGPYEITEDFLTWKNALGRRIVSEPWIYQHREFWSQSPWWNNYIDQTVAPTTNQEKDPGLLLPTTLTPTTRELLARSTLLTLDMAVLQEYLTSRGLNEAIADRIASAGPAVPTVGANTLASMFNGVIYAARTNRYPWNPNMDGANPWNVALPNATVALDTNDELLAKTPANRAVDFDNIATAQAASNQNKLHSGSTAITNHLQPYTTLTGDQAPAFLPTQFHHGVRLVNGASINWGFTTSSPAFGTGKTAIITPNLLYVQGNFNTTKQAVTKNGMANTLAYVPVAIMGDQVNFLSNAWNDANWKVSGITAHSSNGLSSACLNAKTSLSQGWQSSHPLPTASATAVVAAVVTHNQPTTRESVKIGESASIIGTMLFLENWVDKAFDYTGSLVVMDSRRYTQSYQLDASKSFGPSPFGFMGSTWRTHHGLTASGTNWGTTSSNIQIPASYLAPQRSFTFNPDLLTPQGTPPFAPFGTSARGVGGWVRVIH